LKTDMKRTCIVALVWASSAVAQGFSQLATNRDGSVLYFSSPLRMKGTDQYLHPKIFSWDKISGVRLFDQRPLNVGYPIPPVGLRADYYALQVPDVSSDGSTVAVTAVMLCNFGTACRTSAINLYQTTIYAAGNPGLTAPGNGSLSRNGRYVILRSSGDEFSGFASLQLLDLQTGDQVSYGPVSDQGLARRRQVADDGTVLRGFSLVKNGEVRPIPTNGRGSTPNLAPMINNDATRVVYQANGLSSGPGRVMTYLVAYSITSGSSIDLFTGTTDINGTDATGFGATISDDGSQVAFLNGEIPQVYVIRSDGTGLRQITNLQEAVTEAVLSGDGSAAFAVTASNRIVRIDVATAQSMDVVASTPYTLRNGPLRNDTWTVPVSRGQVANIGGWGFAVRAESAVTPFPLTLGGVELRAGGTTIPIAAVDPDSVGFPAAWDLPDAPVDVEVWSSAASASPFVPGFRVVPVWPSFFSAGSPPLILAGHQDFSGLITSDSPPRGGEILHLYGKDMGPVYPAPPSGLAAPLSPLSELTLPMSCELRSQGGQREALEVLFAGLAPELLNIFQTDVRIPDSLPEEANLLFCHIGDPSNGYNPWGAIR
jgi:uncharacterized protein (TIGR03437 family)